MGVEFIYPEFEVRRGNAPTRYIIMMKNAA